MKQFLKDALRFAGWVFFGVFCLLTLVCFLVAEWKLGILLAVPALGILFLFWRLKMFQVGTNFFRQLLIFTGWVLFVVFLLVSLNFFRYGNIIQGVSLVLLSLACLPPFTKAIISRETRTALAKSFSEGMASIKKDIVSLPAAIYHAPKNILQSIKRGEFKNLSLLGFIIANNLVPLAGIVYYNWNPMGIVLLYFFEVFIIGFFNIIKIIIVCRDSWLLLLFNLVVFCVTYFTFLIVIGYSFFLNLLNSIIGSPHLVDSMPNIIYLYWMGVALFIQHLIFLIQYIISENDNTVSDTQSQLFAPLKHIHVLIICVALGGFASIETTGSGNAMVVILVLSKLSVDIYNWHSDSKSRMIPAAAITNANKKL
ncbi:MAG: hypothetical protein HY063_13980 [Bacteroidetes bacterium]|nr:hypothetical protein [Bacteroidota bacterium]